MDLQTLAETVRATLSPYLAQAGESAVEEVGKKLPDGAGKVWQAITTRFQGKPAAEEAVKDVVAKPDDADNQAAFRKALRKAIETDTTFAKELERLLGEARRAGGDTISTRALALSRRMVEPPVARTAWSWEGMWRDR